jgi:hypothetical protein
VSGTIGTWSEGEILPDIKTGALWHDRELRSKLL